MKATGLSSMGFTGYYKIVGSSRVCASGVALSPGHLPAVVALMSLKDVNNLLPIP
jgi:hypothetical protein